MRYFAPIDFPQFHGGMTRVTTGLAAIGRLTARTCNAKGLAGVLMAGGVAAVLVVANQIVSAWADGHLMLAWVAMWGVVFALLAIFSDAIRGWPASLQGRFAAWRAAAAVRAADEHTWQAAKADPRLMAELQFALMRAERDAAAAGVEPPLWPFARVPADHLAGAAAPAFRAAPSIGAPNPAPPSRVTTNRGFTTSPLPGLPTHMQYLPE